MAWVKYTCGRLESRYRYSNTIVYNNFPFPPAPSPAAKTAVETAAQAVLAERANWQAAGKTLAFLYDPSTMPAALLVAHQLLDKKVDECYGLKTPFSSEAKRVAWLFERYEELVRGKS